ncbi:hypothetical protein EV122DRAFT_252027 [Schizophyllum commune]
MSPTWFAALALPSLRTASRPLGRSAVSETQDIITQVCVTLALYGVQATLFAIAVPVLARKRGNAWKLLSAVTLAFIASSIEIATQMLAFVTQCPLIDLFPTDPKTLAYRLAVLHVYVLSDALLVWRAWVLWHDRLARLLPDSELRFYRREVAAYISPMSTGTHIGGVLMLLFEAGAVYCVISVINMAIDISASPGSSSTPVVFTNAMFLIAGIYPTLIVVAVTAQQHAATKATMRGPKENEGRVIQVIEQQSNERP